MSSNWQNIFCSPKRDVVSHYNKFLCLSLFPKVYASEETELTLSDYKQRIKDYMSKETPNDRLRTMFSRNDFGFLSPELQNIFRGSVSCALLVAVYGGIEAARKAKEDFIRQNMASPFESEFLARRQMTDKMALAAIFGALKNSWKLGSFAAAYLFITTTAATYNNKITVFEHIATGGIVGSISRVNYGLKGMAVAGCLGSFLGLLSGSIILLAMKLSGISFEELRYWQHETYWNKFYDKSLMDTRKHV